MAQRDPGSSARGWFRRSLALTLAVGALVLVLVASRPGYTAFYLASTLAFLLAGLLSLPGGPPRRRAGVRRRPVLYATPIGLQLARTYRMAVRR